jgi:hypothetical protein
VCPPPGIAGAAVHSVDGEEPHRETTNDNKPASRSPTAMLHEMAIKFLLDFWKNGRRVGVMAPAVSSPALAPGLRFRLCDLHW